jgi:hypothetical protein
MHLRPTICLATAILCTSAASNAGVVSITGQVDLVSTPTVFDQDSSTLNNGRAELFSEVVGHLVLPTYPGASGSPPQFQFDITTAGAFPGDALISQLIQPGWVLSSYVVHWVPLDRTSTEKLISGSITFDRAIAGLQVEQQSTPFFSSGFQLPAIDLSMANYLELCISGESCDSLWLSPDMQTVSFALNATTGTDNFRIFFLDSVNQVAEPDAVFLMLVAVGGLIGTRSKLARSPTRAKAFRNGPS